MNLSTHFSLEELTRSQSALRKGIDNTPGPSEIKNLSRLCIDLLEPIRGVLGVPMHIDSGFRCKEVNAAVGGAKTSAHIDGRAADIVPVGMDLHKAFDIIRNALYFPLDQVIIECDSWIHVAIPKESIPARHQALIAKRVKAGGGKMKWAYEAVK